MKAMQQFSHGVGLAHAGVPLADSRDGESPRHLAELDCDCDSARSTEPSVDLVLDGGRFGRRIGGLFAFHGAANSMRS
jgi:hypothetical protein